MQTLPEESEQDAILALKNDFVPAKLEYLFQKFTFDAQSFIAELRTAIEAGTIDDIRRSWHRIGVCSAVRRDSPIGSGALRRRPERRSEGAPKPRLRAGGTPDGQRIAMRAPGHLDAYPRAWVLAQKLPRLGIRALP